MTDAKIEEARARRSVRIHAFLSSLGAAPLARARDPFPQAVTSARTDHLGHVRLLRHAHRLGAGDHRRAPAAPAPAASSAMSSRAATSPWKRRSRPRPIARIATCWTRPGVRVLASLGVDAPSPLPASLPAWRPFAEVPAALAELRRRGRKIAILSNVDRDLIASSIPQLGLEPDLVVTAQDCGSYKPASRPLADVQRAERRRPG